MFEEFVYITLVCAIEIIAWRWAGDFVKREQLLEAEADLRRQIDDLREENKGLVAAVSRLDTLHDLREENKGLVAAVSRLDTLQDMRDENKSLVESVAKMEGLLATARLRERLSLLEATIELDEEDEGDAKSEET